MAEPDLSTNWIFCYGDPGPLGDTIFFSIYPDFCLNATSPDITSQLLTLHLQITETLTAYPSNHIWHREPFTLTPFPTYKPAHLSGLLRFGAHREEKWFVVFLLYVISNKFPNVSIRVWDSDGQFLLGEAPSHLRCDTATNRCFFRNGFLHIIPISLIPSTPSLHQALYLLSNPECSAGIKASDGWQLYLQNLVKKYWRLAEVHLITVRARVPLSVAKVLKHEPSLIYLAANVDRDMDTTKFPEKMEMRFSCDSTSELVQVVVRMSMEMYNHLMHITFPPYPGLKFSCNSLEEVLGEKITCGLEMMYQLRKRQWINGEENTWKRFIYLLDSSRYFDPALPGSKRYNPHQYLKLLQLAEKSFKNSSLHGRGSAPVQTIDEIFVLPESVDDIKHQELPPWLCGGENAAFQERENGIEELYNSKGKQKSKEELCG